MTGPIASSTAGRRSRAARSSHGSVKHQAKHFAYAAGWKKFEALWNLVIRARQLRRMTPVLEAVLSKVTAGEPAAAPEPAGSKIIAVNPVEP